MIAEKAILHEIDFCNFDAYVCLSIDPSSYLSDYN